MPNCTSSSVSAIFGCADAEEAVHSNQDEASDQDSLALEALLFAAHIGVAALHRNSGQKGIRRRSIRSSRCARRHAKPTASQKAANCQPKRSQRAASN